MKTISGFLESVGGVGGLAAIVMLLGVFVEISPIKVNPLRALFKWIGNAFNSSIETEISEFKTEVNVKFDEIRQEQEKQKDALEKLILDTSDKEIGRLRWEIIDFEGSLVNGAVHSREQYRHVLDALEKYKAIFMGPDPPHDDHYREICEKGDAIRIHYEEHKDNQTELFF